MAEKKMTQVKALEIAVDLMEGFNALDEQVEAREILRGMLEKRNAPRKPRVNKEAEAFREELVEVLRGAGKPMTNAELTAELAVKPQKVANNIRVLEKAGVVVRNRGEKASDKDTFELA